MLDFLRCLWGKHLPDDAPRSKFQTKPWDQSCYVSYYRKQLEQIALELSLKLGCSINLVFKINPISVEFQTPDGQALAAVSVHGECGAAEGSVIRLSSALPDTFRDLFTRGLPPVEFEPMFA
jgi:hypothetical protein